MNTPPGIERGIAMLIFTIGVSLVAVHTLLVALGAQRARLDRRTQVLAPLLTGVFLAAWLGLGLATGDGKNFPIESIDRRLPSAAVSFLPMIAALTLALRLRTMRAIHAATPPEWLIRVQAYRMAGLFFLFPFLYYGEIPASFAIPAAVGDFLTGLAAPWVAARIAQKRPGAIALAMAWNVFGIADLIVAPTSAVLSQAAILNLYPLVLIALFAGPPLGILVHVISLRTLSLSSHRTPARGGRALDDAVGTA